MGDKIISTNTGINGDGNPFSYDQQFLFQLMRIASLRAVEFRPGIDDHTIFTHPNGVTEQKPLRVEDNREIYCNAVSHLYDYIYFNLKDFTPRKGEEKMASDIIEQHDKIIKMTPTSFTDFDDYKNAVVEEYRELFRRILHFSNRLNYYSRRSKASEL